MITFYEVFNYNHKCFGLTVIFKDNISSFITSWLRVRKMWFNELHNLPAKVFIMKIMVEDSSGIWACLSINLQDVTSSESITLHSKLNSSR